MHERSELISGLFVQKNLLIPCLVHTEEKLSLLKLSTTFFVQLAFCQKLYWYLLSAMFDYHYFSLFLKCSTCFSRFLSSALVLYGPPRFFPFSLTTCHLPGRPLIKFNLQYGGCYR